MGIYLCTAELGGVKGRIFFVFHSCAFSLIINRSEAPYLSCIQSTYVRIFISQKPRKITGSKDSEVWLRFWLIARPGAWARSWAKQGHQSCFLCQGWRPGRPSEERELEAQLWELTAGGHPPFLETERESACEWAWSGVQSISERSSEQLQVHLDPSLAPRLQRHPRGDWFCFSHEPTYHYLRWLPST